MINIDISVQDVVPLIQNHNITLVGSDGNFADNYMLFSYHLDSGSAFGGIFWFKKPNNQDSLYSIGITEITNIRIMSNISTIITIDTHLYPRHA